jgi:hypothetical protein
MAGPLGCCWEVRQWPAPKLKTSTAGLLGVCRLVWQRSSPKLKTSITDPLGVLSGGLARATTEVEDVDGGAPMGCCRDFQQRPPPKLETLMAATTEVEYIDDTPTVRRCQSWRSGSAHQTCYKPARILLEKSNSAHRSLFSFIRSSYG